MYIDTPQCFENNITGNEIYMPAYFSICVWEQLCSIPRIACHIEVFVPVFYDLLYCIFALKQWLFGYELTDTLLVFAKSSINILASKKKIDFLKPLQEAQKKHEGFPAINLHLRDKVLFI